MAPATHVQGSMVVAKLFKIAVQIRQDKNKNDIVRHLPNAYPLRGWLQTSTERLYLLTPAKAFNLSWVSHVRSPRMTATIIKRIPIHLMSRYLK